MGVDTIHGYRRNNVYGAGGIGEMVMHAKAVNWMSSKPEVFNYHRYEDLKEEVRRMREQMKKLRETAFWADYKGERDDDSEYCVYCSGCGAWSEYRTRYCGCCGRRMVNPEVSDE